MPHDADTHERLTNLAHLASAVGHHVINAYAAIVSNAEILRLTMQSEDPPDPVVVADLIIRTGIEASAVARRLRGALGVLGLPVPPVGSALPSETPSRGGRRTAGERPRQG